MKATFLCFVLGICHRYPGRAVVLPSLVKQWPVLEYDYPSEAARQAAINSGDLIPENGCPIDVEVYYPGGAAEPKIFVTVPPFSPGVPFSIGTVTNKVRNGSPVIAPYPSWDWYKKQNIQECKSQRITTVFRVKADRCNRLWVLDNSVLIEKRNCPPQILAFDLTTDQLIHRHEIPSSLLTDATYLVTPIIDIRDTCEDVFVYSADPQGFAIFVYDVKKNLSYKVIDKTFYPWPTYGTYNIAGSSFELMDGVLGMDLDPYVIGSGKDRRLFYHAMSSPTENFVWTSHLRNSTRFISNPSSSPGIFYTYNGHRYTQSAAEAMDKSGILYFGLHSDIKLACFNTGGDYGSPQSTDIVASDPRTLQFISGIKVVKNPNGFEELWFLSSRYQRVITKTLKTTEINFRIQKAKIKELIAGTYCDRQWRNNVQNGPTPPLPEFKHPSN